ncbi:MAG: MTAP family purine nucleoside phosphorylase [Planctomycetota bacterium]|jgi:5'-methylthioadenosine phosphorylase
MAEDLIGIVGGTGLGEALADKLADARISVVDTPFGRPSSGIMMGRMGDKKIAFLNRHGDGHKLAPADVPFAANMEIAPKELVTVDQFIDKTFGRQSSFFSGVAAVHCEMSIPVCDRLRKKIFEAAADIDVKTHESGTYVCMEGPQFSTRAESLMHREWGGDLIGMTAIPEAKLAREAQMCYALIALASDYDCWRPHEPGKDKQTLLREIIGNLQEATANAIKLIEAVLQKSDRICDEDCPCRKALELAVWTTEQHIDAKDKEKLSVLFK